MAKVVRGLAPWEERESDLSKRPCVSGIYNLLGVRMNPTPISLLSSISVSFSRVSSERVKDPTGNHDG